MTLITPKPIRCRGVVRLLLVVAIAVVSSACQIRSDGYRVHKSAATGDLDSLKRAVSRHPDGIDDLGAFSAYTLKMAMTPLMLAAQGGHVDCVRYLVASGADVNTANDLGWTALLFAVDESHVEVVDVLLQAGADPNIVATNGTSPLGRAVRRGDLPIATRLLDAGADPDLDIRTSSPLFEAIEAGQVQAVRLLVERGARVNGHLRPYLPGAMDRLPPEKAQEIRSILANYDV